MSKQSRKNFRTYLKRELPTDQRKPLNFTHEIFNGLALQCTRIANFYLLNRPNSFKTCRALRPLPHSDRWCKLLFAYCFEIYFWQEFSWPSPRTPRSARGSTAASATRTSSPSCRFRWNIINVVFFLFFFGGGGKRPYVPLLHLGPPFFWLFFSCPPPW
jgi:hypothetical protein